MKDLEKTEKNLFVSSWMSNKVITVDPEDRLVDAFELMRAHQVRHIPVVEKGRLVGIVSDRDVRHALPLRARSDDMPHYGKALFGTRIADVMTRNPFKVRPEATIHEAAEIICREKVGALPVVSDDRLVGIISAEDLLWAFLSLSRELEYR